MYERSGEPRRSWYDPLGFVGLDKEPPPPAAEGLLSQKCVGIERRRVELEEEIAQKLSELRAVTVEMLAMEALTLATAISNWPTTQAPCAKACASFSGNSPRTRRCSGP